MSISIILIFSGLIIAVIALILLLRPQRDLGRSQYDAQFEYQSSYSATRPRVKSAPAF